MAGLPAPSDEQQLVIDAFKKGRNVKIEAVAGGGKTTTLLHLARSRFELFDPWEFKGMVLPSGEIPLMSDDEMSFGSPNSSPGNSPMSYSSEHSPERVEDPEPSQRKALLLTYNKSLQLEVKSKVEELGMTSYLDVFTFHGFATRVYCSSGREPAIYNDKMLRKSILSDQPHFEDIYDVVLIDEVQDLNVWFYQFINVILDAFHPQIALVGDPRQCINQYMGSDLKYFAHPEEYFKVSFQTFKLRTSFRLTQATAQFVNNHLMSKSVHRNLLIGGNECQENLRPTYIIGAYQFGVYVDEAVKKYGCQNVMILTPSVKKSIIGNPRTPLGSFLSESHSYPISVKDEYATERSLKNKLIISTFNSSKGMERKCIFVLSFDDAYSKFYAKDYHDQFEPPNLLYVALTRAKEKLYVVQGDRDLPFHTVNTLSLRQDCEIVGKQRKVRIRPPKFKIVRSVESSSKYRPLDEMLSLISYLDIETNSVLSRSLNSDHVEFKDYCEDVKRFYEVLIPMVAQFRQTGVLELDIFDEIREGVEPIDPFFDVFERCRSLLNLGFEYFTVKEWTQFTVCLCAILDRCHFYFDQIRDYDWIDPNFVSGAVDDLRMVSFGWETHTFFATQKFKTDDFEVNGKVDLVSPGYLWIFKYSSSFSDADRVRAAGSSALNYLITGKLLPCKLYNVKTSELETIRLQNPQKFIQELFKCHLFETSESVGRKRKRV